MNSTTLVGMSIILVISTIILKELKFTSIPIVSAIFCIIVYVQALIVLIPTVKYVSTLGEDFSLISKYMPYMLKGAGISFLGKISYEMALDFGLASAASSINFATKAMLISLSYPLFNQIMNQIITHLK